MFGLSYLTQDSRLITYTEQSTTRAPRVAKDPLELTLGHGVDGPAEKGATLQQVQWGSRLGQDKHVREQEEHSGPRFPTGRHHQQPALA